MTQTEKQKRYTYLTQKSIIGETTDEEEKELAELDKKGEE